MVDTVDIGYATQFADMRHQVAESLYNSFDVMVSIYLQVSELSTLIPELLKLLSTPCRAELALLQNCCNALLLLCFCSGQLVHVKRLVAQMYFE